jgi:hypothetical protein
MARYIDADELHRRVKEKTNPYGKPTLDYESGVKVLNMIDNALTADVIPRSEVERLVDKWIGEEKLTQDEKTLRLIEALQGEAKRYERYYFNHEYDKLIAEAKQEVAREIFEEIESEIKLALESNYKAKREHIDNNYYCLHAEFLSAVQGKIDALRGIDDFIAELKKKYTEGEHNE